MDRKVKVNDNPHDVRLGDVYEDLDLGRPMRRLKVVAIEDGQARLVNVKTERMTRVRLDRLAARTRNSHGYALIERAPEPSPPVIPAPPPEPESPKPEETVNG